MVHDSLETVFSNLSGVNPASAVIIYFNCLIAVVTVCCFMSTNWATGSDCSQLQVRQHWVRTC